MTLRRAIDPSGSLGLFYNIHRDAMLGRKLAIDTVKKVRLPEPIRCHLMEGNTEQSENLLKMIGIDSNLRLNILLKSIPHTGISALVHHTHPIDCYTRFLYIFYGNREQRLPDDPTETQKYMKSLVRDANATHIITAVRYGIDIVAVLQLPSNYSIARKIDASLKKIQTRLNNCNNFSNFTIVDEYVLEDIVEAKFYSNISKLTQMTSLLQICQFLNGYKNMSDSDPPIIYNLQLTEWLYPNAHEPHDPYIPLEEYQSDKIEQYLIEISNQMKKVKYFLDSDANKLLFDYLKTPLLKARDEQTNLQQDFEDAIKRLRSLVFDIRSGLKDACQIDEALKNMDQTTLKESISQLEQHVNDLKAKEQLIRSLQQEYFEYSNVINQYVNQNDTEETCEKKLIKDNNRDRILCSDDALNKNNESRLNKLRDQVVKEKQINPDLHLIYADFTYCAFKLHNMMILPSNKEPKIENRNRQPSPLPYPPTGTPDITSPPTGTPDITSPPPPPDNEIINILLLGESGVGKSTFINAFVNYLKFQTLTKAESCKPVVLIPVSFLLTIGDHFEEKTITFGDSDDLNNEDFDHPGQSVTQHCKSYVFKLNDYDGRKMRIIDTPGFGDTRGLDQDDFNMKHILEYINNLKYLNAICFLLKPNVSQIHNFFRDYLTQVLDILGSDFRHNIVFCFTNSRSTFYTPGDTAPLLKRILKTLSMDDLPFKKGNTFCFDNESFRYLVALQKSITFDKLDKAEYENSWSKSVDESKRLLDYVCAKLCTYPKQIKWQSIKHAQLQITYMIRPMLEAMRNILRNMIIREMDPSSKLIELKPRSLYRPASVCFVCKRELIQKGKFWIVCDVPHEIQKKCYYCNCGANQHMPIYYKLEYEDLDNSSNYSRKEMKERLARLRNASVEFAHFLMYVARSSKDDPFFIGITQMISEENDICKRRKSNNEMNLQLVKNLTELWQKYEQKIDIRQSDQQHSKLSIIYEWIQDISKYSMVEIQMSAVRETKQEIMKLYEYEVPEY